MNKPFAYIASPYSDPNPDVVEARVEIITKITAAFLNRGINAMAPIIYGHSIVKKHKLPSDWGFWHNFLTPYISCSYIMYVVMLDGWRESIGLWDERCIAYDHGIKIEYLDPKNFEKGEIRFLEKCRFREVKLERRYPLPE